MEFRNILRDNSYTFVLYGYFYSKKAPKFWSLILAC
nr:MAG TPA: hypothetical protein [Caudoviricetes sp.]